MLISEDNLFAWWSETHFPFYREWTGPFLVAHDLHQLRRREPPWPWDLDRAVEGSLDKAWDMTGKWLARRAAKVDRRRFNQEVVRITSRLACTLNEHKVASLRDLCELSQRDWGEYTKVVSAIHDAIHETSAIKPTAVLKPMFGSKVLHHYFPSVIPVFDSAWVLNGVMKGNDYRAFLASEQQDWRCLKYERSGLRAKAEGELDDYHDYLYYCVARLSDVDSSELSALRVLFGEALSASASPRQRFDHSSLLWHLDAKITEWCMCGAAWREGVLR